MMSLRFAFRPVFTALLGFAASPFLLSQSHLLYGWQFNLDEGLPGSQVPISDTTWNLHYGPSGLNGVGDPNILSGNSEGPSAGPKLMMEFQNPRNRGFLFASGKTGVAPEAFFFFTRNLATTRKVMGMFGSETVQDQWNVAENPPTVPLAEQTVGGLVSLNAVINSIGGSGVSYRFAFEAGGVWYLDAVGASSCTWAGYRFILEGSTLIPLNFTPDVGMDTDVSETPTISITDLDPGLTVTGYGMFVKTGGLQGTDAKVESGTWSRMDAYVIEAMPVPPS